jgi:hypothetical protein
LYQIIEKKASWQTSEQTYTPAIQVALSILVESTKNSLIVQ